MARHEVRVKVPVHELEFAWFELLHWCKERYLPVFLMDMLQRGPKEEG